MVFRKENKVDAFQRQISALRQQLGGSDEREADEPMTETSEGQEGASDNPAGGDATPFATRPALEGSQGRAAEGSGFNFGGFALPSSGDGEQSRDRATAPSSPPPPPEPAPDMATSVIAHDTSWKGDLQSEGTLHVHGRVEGSLRARHKIFIAEEAEVDAVVNAETVIVAGLVRGTIRCTTRFEALPQGRLNGEIQSPTLVIHDGAVINAEVRMGASDATSLTRTPAIVHRRSANRPA